MAGPWRTGYPQSDMSMDRRPLPVAHRYSSGWGGRGSHRRQHALHGRTGRGPARPGGLSRPRDQDRYAVPRDRQRRLPGARQHRRWMARKQAAGHARHTTPTPKRIGRAILRARETLGTHNPPPCVNVSKPTRELRSPRRVALLDTFVPDWSPTGGRDSPAKPVPDQSTGHPPRHHRHRRRRPPGQCGSDRYDFGRTPRQARIPSRGGCRPKPARKVVEQLSGHLGRTTPPPAARILRPGRRGICAPP